MFGAKCSHSPLADGDTLRLVEIGGEFGRCPVGPVQATACGAWFDPGYNLRGQGLGNAGSAARGPAAPESVEAPRAIGIEPALQGPWGDTQVFSDLVRAPPPVGHQESLAAVAQTAVGSGFKGVFELLAIVIVQGDMNYESILPARTLGG